MLSYSPELKGFGFSGNGISTKPTAATVPRGPRPKLTKSEPFVADVAKPKTAPCSTRNLFPVGSCDFDFHIAVSGLAFIASHFETLCKLWIKAGCALKAALQSQPAEFDAGLWHILAQGFTVAGLCLTRLLLPKRTASTKSGHR